MCKYTLLSKHDVPGMLSYMPVLTLKMDQLFSLNVKQVEVSENNGFELFFLEPPFWNPNPLFSNNYYIEKENDLTEKYELFFVPSN